MKKRMILLLTLVCYSLMAQNTNLDSLITQTQWNSLFPKRAGTFGTHPQGYTTDFYSYANLKQAVSEMADYKVTIRKKIGVWGELTTVTRISTNITYNYSDVEAWWHANTTPETVIYVDFKDFVNRVSKQNNKRELAAFLANISKETTGGWQTPVGGGTSGDYAQWGLYFVHEVGYSSATSAGTYSQAHAEYPPNASKGYYGRGPIQLSWNYNYGQFSKFIFNDKNVLLNNPDTIQKDGVLAFKSAIWFWMMPQCPKPSCHQVLHNLWLPATGEYSANKMYNNGFAHTNNIINGGLECRTTSSAAFTQKVALRSDLYKYYLGVAGFNAAQIASENSGNNTSLCYESSTVAMQDYANCAVIVCTPNASTRTKTICANQTYFYNNQIMNIDGNYKDTFVNSQGCDSIETLTLIVNPTKKTTLNSSICQGDSVYFNNTHKKLTGLYNDTLIASNGCDSLVQLNLIIKPISQTNIAKSICQNDSLYFDKQYRKTAGIYQAKIINHQGCDSNVYLTLTINSLPILTITQSNTQLTATAGYVYYKWYYNSSLLTTTSNIHNAALDGQYAVEAENINGCKNSAKLNYAKRTAGMAFELKNNIEFYPQPTAGILFIHGMKAPSLAIVYDIMGSKQMEVVADNSIDLSRLNSGFYWIELGNIRKKIVVQKQ